MNLVKYFPILVFSAFAFSAAVSYTHLDVYKRQARSCEIANGSCTELSHTR